jgi:ankyrin repeat protein
MSIDRALESDFIREAVVPLVGAHANGDTTRAAARLIAHPELASASIHTAAILGDVATVRRYLAADAGAATARGGPHDWDALTHLAFSNFLKRDAQQPDGSADFVGAARALLDAGANVSTGVHDAQHGPTPTFESVLYGAAGVAHHPGLTQLLLDRSADPNDDEVPYHVGESYDNRAMEVLVESGRLSADSLGVILIRKCDWHDLDGVRYLLACGVDPNHCRRWNTTTLHHAIKRDNAIDIIEMLLAHGADPFAVAQGLTCVQLALRVGRDDVLDLLEASGIPLRLEGIDPLLHALVFAETERIAALAAAHPHLVQEVLAFDGDLLARWDLTGNAGGVRALLELGVPIDAPYLSGDGYWGIPRGASALHVAAWLARHDVVHLLVASGAAVHARIVHDGRLVTPLHLAVRATVDSHWTSRRSPRSVRTLIEGGADRAGLEVPCG